MEMTIPVKFAEPYSPDRCRRLRDEDMDLARRARLPRDHQFFRVNNEIVQEAVQRARKWNRCVLQGGNAAYHYCVANGQPTDWWPDHRQ